MRQIREGCGCAESVSIITQNRLQCHRFSVRSMQPTSVTLLTKKKFLLSAPVLPCTCIRVQVWPGLVLPCIHSQWKHSLCLFQVARLWRLDIGWGAF